MISFLSIWMSSTMLPTRCRGSCLPSWMCQPESGFSWEPPPVFERIASLILFFLQFAHLCLWPWSLISICFLVICFLFTSFLERFFSCGVPGHLLLSALAIIQRFKTSALKFPVAFPFGLSFQLTSEMCSIISALGSMLGCKPNFPNSARALKFEMLWANADWSDAIISLCFCSLIAKINNVTHCCKDIDRFKWNPCKCVPPPGLTMSMHIPYHPKRQMKSCINTVDGVGWSDEMKGKKLKKDLVGRWDVM